MNDKNDEQSLIARARAGDREAFGILVRRYEQDLFNLARNLVSVHEEAQDLTAEAFSRAWRHIGSFRDEAAFKTWLWRILTNLCRSHLRRRYLQRKIFFWQKTVVDDDEDERSEYSWEDPAISADPERYAEQRNIRHVLKLARRSLSPREQEVFTLKYDDHMKISEIARQLALSENTVKVLLFRATRKLARALQEYRK